MNKNFLYSARSKCAMSKVSKFPSTTKSFSFDQEVSVFGFMEQRSAFLLGILMRPSTISLDEPIFCTL